MAFLKGSIICYNSNYNNSNKGWVLGALKRYRRGSVLVCFHPHAELRMHARNIDVDRIVETVRKGAVLENKCTMPDSIAFRMFFNEGYTYIVIAKTLPNSLEVRTAWKKKGRI